MPKFWKKPVYMTALFVLTAAFAAPLETPPLNGPVNDLAGILRPQEKSEITSFLLNLNQNSKAQIAVLTIPTLDGDDMESFSMGVADTWQIGDKKLDSGALLVIALAEHEIAIKTGYGVEGNLTDAKCGLIIRNVLAPAFQQKQYGPGIYEAVKTMAGVILEDETLISPKAQEDRATDTVSGAIFSAIFMLIMFCAFVWIGGSRRRTGFRSSFAGAMLGSALGNMAGRGGSRSSFGGGFSGGGFSGGFSGGGGSFGGGGAHGRW
jgi:uncharacterized protein